MSTMGKTLYDIEATAHMIRESGKSIYDPLGPEDESLWLPNLKLEQVLNESLRGMSLHGLPLRTRSKAVKEAVCKALGYPVPSSFKKTKPRFPGQNFDTYIQKANNLQVWNEELAASRRYVLIRVSADDVVERVVVLLPNHGGLLCVLSSIESRLLEWPCPRCHARALGS